MYLKVSHTCLDKAGLIDCPLMAISYPGPQILDKGWKNADSDIYSRSTPPRPAPPHPTNRNPPYPTLPYPTLPYPTLPYPTLPYPNLT